VELVSSGRPRATFVGEGMLELSVSAPGGWGLLYGGDTLNTAIHMARLGLRVAYATAIGSDSLSATLRTAWMAEGLDCSLVLTDPERSTGLYAISVDAAGERSFVYWRNESAATRMFSHPEAAPMADAAAGSDLLAFSLISLAILPDAGRRDLLDLAHRVRARGGVVAFDGNYRARLWPDRDAAARARDEAISVANIGLPTLEDEAAISGDRDADAVAAHWQGLGCAETVVKLGPAGCRLPDGTLVSPAEQLRPVDTSGAGDAFNAGYLGARLGGATPGQAAGQGHRIAGWTIMRPGAIPAPDEAAPYGRTGGFRLPRSSDHSTTAPTRSSAARATKSGL
jgi:2-dehydro-3-deoxygluconokinase